MKDNAATRRLTADRKKALRALRLWERGHSLQQIAEMCEIPGGSVTARIRMGERLRNAGITE